MNESIIENWNNTVGATDTVYHLGDVALGPWDKWHNILTRLNGYKVLVVGNHDRIFKGEKPKMQERFKDNYDTWFDEVHHDLRGLWLENGEIVDLSHFPYDGDSHGEERYREYRLNDAGRVLIHGHTHLDQKVSKSKRGTLQVHVGADAWNYTPVSEEQVISIIENN